MKRLLLCLLVMLLPCCVLGEELRVFPAGNDFDRVKLRQSPGGRVIGQYYADVHVAPLEQRGDWTRISIGGYEGWMMTEFLPAITDEWLAENDWRGQGMIGALYCDAETRAPLPLFSAPDADADALCLMAQQDSIRVLGTIDDDWLHILHRNSEGTETYGFASAWDVTWTDNFSGADVDTGDPAQRLNLRTSPSTSGERNLELYSGVRVAYLFDNHVNGDGWSKVRVGFLTGYVKDDYLNDASAGVLAYEPPLCLMPDGCSAQVLGVQGDQLYVKLLDGDAFRLISRSDVSRYTPRSARTTACVNCAVTIGDGISEYHLPEGHNVCIYGSFEPSTDRYVWGYILPQDPLLYVDFQIPDDTTWTSGYIPVDCVDFDPQLLAPSMQ